MTKKIGVILSGCGFKDGAEIHESVLTLLALDRAGVDVVCMAPNVEQTAVVDHLTGKATHEKRNVLVEAARIARGQIRDIATVDPNEIDGVVLPGGFGAATNLSDFASRGAKAHVDAGVRRIVEAMFEARKPIGAICIAPGVVAVLLGKHRVKLTIGNDPATADNIAATGAEHEPCVTEACVVDADHRIVSTPAYMLGPRIRHIAAGIDRLVTEVVRMAREH